MKTTTGATSRARVLRRRLTAPEVRLWAVLRSRPAGLKFRRQAPAGPHVLDFFCPAAALAIEVDGAAHDMGDNPARDIARDAWLARQGLEVLRVPAREVMDNLEGVVRLVVARALERTPPPREGAVPLPAKAQGG